MLSINPHGGGTAPTADLDGVAPRGAADRGKGGEAGAATGGSTRPVHAGLGGLLFSAAAGLATRSQTSRFAWSVPAAPLCRFSAQRATAWATARHYSAPRWGVMGITAVVIFEKALMMLRRAYATGL